MSKAAENLLSEILAIQNPDNAALSQRFFKTGIGQYGEGDVFLGVRVPQIRAIVKKYYKDITIQDLQSLLTSKWHEVRLAAVIVMAMHYPKAAPVSQKQLYDLYIAQTGKGINNWDIIDVTCPHVVGAYLFDKDREALYELAKGNLWQKRVSIISTFYFLRNNDPIDTYKLAEILVYEQHDLLHKAVGWSLREIGKCDGQLLRQFLDKYAGTMPRTALRYALERLPLPEKEQYMKLKVNASHNA